MGASNVAKVFTNWRHLSHREARALTYMALISLDADNPPVFFGGWEAVAAALGLDCQGKRASAERATMQVFAALREAGAIVSSGQARMKVRAEYAISLDPAFTFLPADSGIGGGGRGVSWSQIPRDTLRNPRESEDSLNETFRQVPEWNVQAEVNETFRQVPEQNVRKSLNETYMPMSTEEPLGGIPEEKHGGVQITNQKHLTTARTKEQRELIGRSAIEDQRSKQLADLERLFPDITGRKVS
ncbi:hypothetical protein [Paenarthrobacter sp. NPDC091669]|uniref:hypothetical protein n=1 Tax=Paenarthrobacter sp. NPDC091669 TaxID=3364384 RepID=UPI003828F606